MTMATRDTRPLVRARGTEGGRSLNAHQPTRRLSALPPIGARFAVHPLAASQLRQGLRELPGQLTPEALTAAFDAWMEGSVASTVRDGVATIPIRGVLTKEFSWWSYWTGSSSYASIAHDLAVALADESVTSIVLAVDSPGGEVDGCHELAALVQEARTQKPVIAHVDGYAASAAYWITSAADTIYVAPTALVGSIGVCLTIIDYSKLEAEIGIEVIDIVSTQSPRKIPDPTTEDGRAQLLTVVDALADVFIADVAAHRGVTPDVVLAQFGGGDVFVGAGAVAAGLADTVGTYAATHRALADAAAPQLIQSITLASGAGARVPGGVVAALQAVADAASHPATPGTVARTPDEVFMAHTIAASRPAASASAAEPDPTDDQTPDDDGTTEDEETTEGAPTAAEGDEAGEGDEEEDAEAQALAATHPQVLARVKARAAARERTRITAIRALGVPGQEAVIAACIADPTCTEAQAALALMKHERSARADHLRALRGDEEGFTAPPASAAPTPTGDAAVIGSIVSTFQAHHPTHRRPAGAGRP